MLSVEHNTNETIERRRRKQEDVQKQMAYRKAHGYDVSQGLEPWPLPEKAMRGVEARVKEIRREEGIGGGSDGDGNGNVGEGEIVGMEKRPRGKRWLGIF